MPLYKSPLYVYVAGTKIGEWSSTGLSVTGSGTFSGGTLSGGTSGTGYSFSGSAAAGSLALDSGGNLITPEASFSYEGYVEIANGGTGSLKTGLSAGMYMVYARQNASANGGIRAMGLLTQGSSTNAFDSLVAQGGATLSADGTNGVNLTNNAGGTLGVKWSIVKVQRTT